MARPITWAIRLTFADGQSVFVREGRQIGRGPIATFRHKASADAEADLWRMRTRHAVDVIERSHGATVASGRARVNR
jgi:hypothetical protein